MEHRLLFPEIKKFHELFTLDKAPIYHPNSRQRVWRMYELGANLFSSYCSISGMNVHHSIAVRPHASILNKLADELVVPGHLHFEIVRRDVNEALVVVKYDQILGDRWLAIIDGHRLPKDPFPYRLGKDERLPQATFADQVIQPVRHEVEIRDSHGKVISRSKNLAQLRRHRQKIKIVAIDEFQDDTGRLSVLFENGDSCETNFGDFRLLKDWVNAWGAAKRGVLAVNSAHLADSCV